MTIYTRQIYVPELREWKDQIKHHRSETAEQQHVIGYIHWSDGPEGRIGVGENEELYRIVPSEEVWRIYVFNIVDREWKLYSPDTAENFQEHVERFHGNVTFHIPVMANPENVIYGVNGAGTFIRLKREG